MKKYISFMLGFAVLVQRGLPGMPLKVGLSDILLISVLCGAGVGLIKKRIKLSEMVPPLSISIFAGIIAINGLFSCFRYSDLSIVKEQVQAIEILFFGWAAYSYIFGNSRENMKLFFTGFITALGIESLLVFCRILFAENYFYTGIMTLNRNSFGMAAMCGAPLVFGLIAEDKNKVATFVLHGLLFFLFAAVFSAGAVFGGLIGIIAVFLLSQSKRRLVYGFIPVLAACVLIFSVSGWRRTLLASVKPNLKENYLIKERDDEYQDKKNRIMGRYPLWFSQQTALRYRRWGYSISHGSSSLQNFLTGSGPGSFNRTLRPFMAEDGKPPIDENEIMMFNIAVNEPDSFSAYAVQFIENGFVGLLGLFVLLFSPLVIFFIRKLSGERTVTTKVAAGSIMALIVVNMFHSFMITGMFLFSAGLVYIVHMCCQESD